MKLDVTMVRQISQTHTNVNSFTYRIQSSYMKTEQGYAGDMGNSKI